MTSQPSGAQQETGQPHARRRAIAATPPARRTGLGRRCGWSVAVVIGHGVEEREGSPGSNVRGARRLRWRSGRGSGAAELRPGLDPVVLGLAGRGRVRRRRSRPAVCSSTRSCRSRPRRSRASARSDPARCVSASSQACWLVGASPNQTVAWPLASADIMWSIHMNMQFGCLAFAAIIQVSDQPVEPSSGRTPSIGWSSACSRFTRNCQVVPIVTSPAPYDATWSL